MVLVGAVVRRRAPLGVAGVLAALALLGPGSAAGAAPACTLTWAGHGASTSWSDVNNWDLVRAPVSSDVVCIPAGVTAEPTVTASTTVSSVQALSPVAVGVAGSSPATLTTTDTANSTAFAQLDVAAGSGLTSGGPTAVSGALNAGDGTTPQYATLSGNIAVAGALSAKGFVRFAGAGSTTDVLPGATWSITGNGNHTVDGGHTLKTEGTGLVTASLQSNGQWTNTGTVHLNGPAQYFTVTGSVTNSGTVILDPASGPLTFEGAVTDSGSIEATGVTTPPTSSSDARIIFDYLSNLTVTGSLKGADLGPPTMTLGPGTALADDLIASSNVTIPAGATATTNGTTLQGTVRGDGVLRELGAMTVPNSGTSPTIGGNLALEITNGAALAIRGAFSVADNAELQTDGATSVTGAGLSIGSYGQSTGAVWVNSGAVVLDNATVSSYNGSNTPNDVFNTGTITENAASSASNVNYSTMTSVLNDGTLEVVRGRLLIAALTETTGATMRVHIAGTTAATSYGQFAFNPNYSSNALVWDLSGTFQVVLDNGFTPAVGDVYNVIAPSGGRYGDFTGYTGLGLGGGASLVPAWGGGGNTTLTLTARAPAAAAVRTASAPAPAAIGPPPAAAVTAARSSTAGAVPVGRVAPSVERSARGSRHRRTPHRGHRLRHRQHRRLGRRGHRGARHR